MITPSSQSAGRVSGVASFSTGVATLSVTGSFAAAMDLTYTIEIDSIAGGTEVGQATFKWRTSETGAGLWEETGVLTRTSPAYALSADGLGGGLSVSWTGGVGDDFALADTWKFEALATYGPERPLDLNRMTYLEFTGDTSESLVIDLGTATTISSVILLDHNLTSAATVTIEGNATDSWGAPTYTSTFSPITDPLSGYLSQTFRYFRLTFADAANPDGVIRIGGLYLGSYFQLTQVNAIWGSSEINGSILQVNTSEAAVMRRYYYASQQTLALNMGNVLKNSDVESILDIQDALVSQTTHRVLPLFVHLFSDTSNTLKLMEWVNLGKWQRTYFSYLLNSGVTFDLAEVVKV